MPTVGHESSPGLEHAPVLRERVTRHVVEDQIVARLAVREVLPGVVDDMVRSDRSDGVQVPRAAHAGHFRPEDLGDLHCEGSHAPRRTVDQDLLPGLHLAVIAKRLHSGPVSYTHLTLPTN